MVKSQERRLVYKILIISLLIFGGYSLLNYLSTDREDANYSQVETEDFSVIGLRTTRGDYFLGILYAESGLFELTRKKEFKGIFNATDTTHTCPFYGDNANDRYCPYLNIYRCFDSMTMNNALNVLVYIGTPFHVGDTSAFHPPAVIDNYACQGSIVVLLNYRQGPFGYFVTGKDFTGNVALYDVKTGLEWIQDNIKYFGGNPKNVTVIGAGDGGVIASLLSRLPETSNLIHKLVLMEGSSYSPFLIKSLKFGIEGSRSLAIKTKCANEKTWKPGKVHHNQTGIISCMKSKNAYSVFKNYHDLTTNQILNLAETFFPWPFVVDQNLIRTDLLSSKNIKFQKIPTFIISCGISLFDGPMFKKAATNELLKFFPEFRLYSRYYKHYRDYYAQQITNDFNGEAAYYKGPIRRSIVARLKKNFVTFGPSLMEAQAVAANKSIVYFLRILNNNRHLQGPSCLGKEMFNDFPGKNFQNIIPDSYEKIMADMIMNFVNTNNPQISYMKDEFLSWNPRYPRINILDKRWFYTKSIRQIETSTFWLCDIAKSRKIPIPIFCRKGKNSRPKSKAKIAAKIKH